MIVTVTANTTADHTVLVRSFQKNTTMRAVDSTWSTGGKPTDASLVLGEIGIPSLALGIAAGDMGRRVEKFLKARGVTPDFVQAEGETRAIMVIIDESDHSHSTITTSAMQVNEEHVAALIKRYAEALNEATVVVLGGTLPAGMKPSFYTDTIRMARERNIPVVFDAVEPNLSAGLISRPTFIKPNRDELSAYAGRPLHSLEELYTVGRAIVDKFGTMPIITMGGEGGLAVLTDRAYRIPPLKIKALSPGGAGDAVLAGLTAALYRKQPIEEGLRLGFAAAAAVTLTLGTADCHRADVERLLPQVELIPYQP